MNLVLVVFIKDFFEFETSKKENWILQPPSSKIHSSLKKIREVDASTQEVDND